LTTVPVSDATSDGRDADREPALELVDAAARRGARHVWSHVDMTVRESEFVAVLGPNGSGKSTLLRVLLGLLPLTAGRATVLGQHPAAARRHVGYLPQRGGFDSSARLRGIDIVRLGLDGSRWGVPLPGPAARRARARVMEAIELVGAGEYASRPIGRLSGGEQQRLLIAQALVSRPRLLLLDEPLDGLDLPNQAAVASLVARICARERVTVLLVAHDVNPVLGHLDRVVYFAGGRAAQGAPEEVMSGSTLSSLYGVPIEVLRTAQGRLVVVGPGLPPGVHDTRHGV
jgi:zinc/manganese transport system ATP-binding protein